MGIQNISEIFESAIRCCECHYADSDFFVANGSVQLRFDALPKGRQSHKSPVLWYEIAIGFRHASLCDDYVVNGKLALPHR
jgi:hypothetical protein